MIRPLAASLLLLLPPQDNARGLVEKLRSDSAAERGEAERKLRELGRAALPELEKAAKDPDAEVAGRAQRLLRLIPLSGVVSPKLRSALPGVEDRLSSEDGHAWTAAFLEGAARPGLRRADLEPLAARALHSAAGPEETRAVLEAVAGRRMGAAVPEVTARLKDPDGGVRKEAIETLFELRAKEALPELAACLRDPNHGVREEALVAIWRLGREEALPLLLPAFKDPSPDVRLRITTWLAGARGPGVVAGFMGFLNDAESVGVVTKSAEVLGSRGVREAVPGIRRLLDDPNGSVRSSGVRALGAMADRKELADLVAFIADDDVFARRAAIDVVRNRRYREGIPEIRKMLGHRSPDVRRAAVLALKELGAWEATKDLAALLRDPDDLVREVIPAALARVRAREAVPALVEVLQDPKVRHGAVKALGELGSVEAVPALGAHLGAAEAHVRESAVESLAALRAEEAGAGFLALLRGNPPAGFAERAGELQLRALVPDLLKHAASGDPACEHLGMVGLQHLEVPETMPVLLQVARSGAHRNRRWAIRQLDGRRSGAEAEVLLKTLEEDDPGLQVNAVGPAAHSPAAIPTLTRLLVSPDEGVRFESLWALRELRAREALPAILARLEDHDDVVREVAVSALRAIGAQETVSVLVGLLRGEPDAVRGEAACALAEMGAPGAEGAALGLLEDPAWHVRTAAARALAVLRTPGARAGIRRLFRDEVDEVRRWALWVAADVAGKEDLPAIAALLADPDAEVRGHACLTLARLGAREATPAIVERLADRRDFVRRFAVEALLEMGAKEAVPAIAPLLEDPVALVRERAAWAVALLEGADRLVPLLADEDEGVRRAAAAAIRARRAAKVESYLRHEWAEARAAACRAMGKGADEIVPLLRDADFEVRAAAAEALGLLRAGEAEVAALLEDREPRVRAAAVAALGAMGSKRPELRKRLEDVRSEVRIAAIRAVGDEAVVKLLSDDHRDVRVAAVEALGRLGKKESILPLLSDPSDRVRKAAGAWLCRLGDRAGFAEALRGEEFFALNAIREPAAWSALAKARLAEAVEGTPRGILERLAREAGLSLEWTPAPLSELPAWRPPFVRLAAGTSALDALPVIVGGWHAVVLEERRLRVLPLRQAREIWRAGSTADQKR